MRKYNVHNVFVMYFMGPVLIPTGQAVRWPIWVFSRNELLQIIPQARCLVNILILVDITLMLYLILIA